MLKRYPLKETRGFFFTPFDAKKELNGRYTPLCSFPCLQSALHAVLIRRMTPDSDFLVPPKRVAAPTIFSKCASSHCSNVDEAVSVMPTNKRKPQKKLFNKLIFCIYMFLILDKIACLYILKIFFSILDLISLFVAH